jgi:hypothetical protein
MIFGTRCSYPHKTENLNLMRQRGVRVFFGIGNREHSTRSVGINRAYQTLKNAGLEVSIQQYSGAHTNPPRSMAGTALAYLAVPSPRRNAPTEEPSTDPVIEPTPPAEEPKEYDDWFNDGDDWFSSAPAPNIPNDWDSWDDDWFNDGDDFFD